MPTFSREGNPSLTAATVDAMQLACMKLSVDTAMPDSGSLQFDRTRDADLHAAIRSERFTLAEASKTRSTAWICACAALPHFYIAVVALIALSPLVWWLQVLLAFAPTLLAQRAMLVLVHDASHRFYSKNRAANDVLADLLAAGFIGMLVRKYRKIHLAHHSANGSADDPEFFSYEVVRAAGGMPRFILGYALGLELPRLLRKYHTKQEAFLGEAAPVAAATEEQRRFEKLSIVTCQLFLVGLFALLRAPHLYLLWLYMAVTWSPLLSRLRFLAEHPGHGELTLTTEARFLERIFFAPLSFHFHFEHHLYPAVPPYRLAAVHADLSATGFFERHPEHVSRSFIVTLNAYERS